MKFTIQLIAVALFLMGPEHAKAEELERWEIVERMVLLDTFTDLEWTRRDNLKGVDWNDAKEYCDSLEMDGDGWRLPAMDELAQLVDERRYGDTPCGSSHDGVGYSCSVSPMFHLGGHLFWSSELEGSSLAWLMSLANGRRLSIPISISDHVRALCVRRRS